MEEFKTLRTTQKKLNKDIQKFRIENPNYEVYNITTSGTGGEMGGTIRFWVIWKRKG
ncbi:MAG: hypothetical protein Lokiarch_19790 [Candidatus Lokiarchaeum sp. GC14_75]|nr:MAG: hypothetical protein Lokiarch_19790 [Candidatus Lokiarchaeum sp. GC14_75]